MNDRIPRSVGAVQDKVRKNERGELEEVVSHVPGPRSDLQRKISWEN